MIHGLLQVQVQSGAVRAFYSWVMHNPSEALHDVMIDIDGDRRSVYIDWNEKADRNSEEVLDDNNQTTLEAPLYGAVVGIKRGQNTFTLTYVDSADQHTGHLIFSLFGACVVLVRYYI